MKKLLTLFVALAATAHIWAANIVIPTEAKHWDIPAEAIDVNQAREICATIDENTTTGTKYYVMGYVSSIDSRHENGINNYGNALFYLEQVKGANSNETFMAYQVYGPGQEKLTDANTVQVGDFVILYGELKHYKYSADHASVYETVGKGEAYIWKSTNTRLGGNGGDNWNIQIPTQAQDWDIPAEAIDVNQARTICATLESGTTTDNEYYVMGYVKSLHAKYTTDVTDYNNARFYLEQVKGANSSETFMAYQVRGKDGGPITHLGTVQVGDFVILYGKLTNYNGTYETVGRSAAYIWKSTNPIFNGEQSDNNDNNGEEDLEDGKVVIRNPQTWTTRQLEPYIGKTIEFKNHFYVTNNYKDGELTIAPRMIFTPTNQARPGSDEYNTLLNLNEQATITLTNINGYHRVGERLHNLKVFVSATNQLQLIACDWRGNTRAELEKGYDLNAIDARGKHNLLVCCMNLEYYMTNNFGANVGPADDYAHATQRQKVSKALAKINADIYGLVEVECGQDALAELAADLTKNTGRTFTYINDGGQANGTSIKAGYIYCTDVVNTYGNLQHNNQGIWNRKKAQAFVQRNSGEKFILSVNHFKAKVGNGSGDNADQGDGQGQFNGDRVREAQSILNNYNNYTSYFNDEDILIVGDLNAYGKEDPIQTLLNDGLTDLHRAFHADSSYSYLYRGQVGYLDHAICNSSMYEQVTGMVTYHINSPERDSYAYDGTKNDNTMFRSSDHDPILIGLALGQIHSDNTATEQISHPSPTSNTRKILRNGQLILIRDGVEYNAVGSRL